jgi:hypothetical protein
MPGFNPNKFEDEKEKALKKAFSRYLYNKMSVAEKEAFEMSLATDPALKVKFQEELLVDLQTRYLHKDDLSIEELDMLIELSNMYSENFDKIMEIHKNLMKEAEARIKRRPALSALLASFLNGKQFKEDKELQKEVLNIFTNQEDDETLDIAIEELNKYKTRNPGRIKFLDTVVVTEENIKEILESIAKELYE